MGRYLTPAKVTLLVLVHIYNQGVVPRSQWCHVLSFLIRHISPDLAKIAPNSSHQQPNLTAAFALPITQFETDLSRLRSKIPGHSVWDVLLQELWSIDCAAALDAFIESLPELLAKSRRQLLRERDPDRVDQEKGQEYYGTIVRTSPLGTFLRRCHLEHSRLQFHDAVAVWQDLVRYRHRTRAAYVKKNNVEGRNLIDVNLSDLGIDGSYAVARIMYDRLNQTAEGEMGRHRIYDNTSTPVKSLFGRRVPHSIYNTQSGGRAQHNTSTLANSQFGGRSQHRTYSTSTPEEQEIAQHSTHDLTTLVEFQIGEMQRLGGRLPDDMRRVLKHMMDRGAAVPKLAYYIRFMDTWRAGDYSSAFHHLHQFFDYTMQSGDHKFYQYALLNLAILQADFGCVKGAVPAMREAIAIARENRDTPCLNFCMSWLYHFGRAYPAQTMELREANIIGSDAEGIAFIKTRARDAEMYSLFSTSLLTEAKVALRSGSSIGLAFENIVKSIHINYAKKVPFSSPRVLLMKASVFGRIGQAHMAKIYGDIFLECRRDDASFEELLKCCCRQAGLLVQRGRYLESELIMVSVPRHVRRVHKFHNQWSYYVALLRLRRLLHRDDLITAGRVITTLKGRDPPDIETDFSLRFLEVDMYMRKGDFHDALRVVEELAERAPVENNDIFVRIKLMTLKARLWAKSDHPMRGFSLAVRAANLAYRARLLPVLWEAVGVLAMVLHHVQEFRAAKQLLDAILPHVMECEDCDLTARMHSLLADSEMGLAGLEAKGSSARMEHISSAMGHIDVAFQQFEIIDDLQGQLEMMSKKSRIHRFRGHLVLANYTADRYVTIWKEYGVRS